MNIQSILKADPKEIVQYYRQASTEELSEKAKEICTLYHGDGVLLRGLVEFSNHCGCDCLYCGIRKENSNVQRYRLTQEQILQCVQAGYDRGLRTFVLQGGEDSWFTTPRLVQIIQSIKELTGPDSAITLSCGIRSKKDYQLLKDAGADRYLIRFETSDPELHRYLRDGITLDRRIQAIRELQETGFQTGSGYMVGLPGETEETRINNALLARELEVKMCGIGPFIPHPDTPLKNAPQEPLELAVRATALVRMLMPYTHIPATTAAGSLVPTGRETVIQAGANVLMPNLTPVLHKKDYLLYPGKICLDESGIQCVGCLAGRVATVGRHLDFAKGDALEVNAKPLEAAPDKEPQWVVEAGTR